MNAEIVSSAGFKEYKKTQKSKNLGEYSQSHIKKIKHAQAYPTIPKIFTYTQTIQAQNTTA